LADPARSDAGTVWVLDDISTQRQTTRDMAALYQNASVGILVTRERKLQRYNPKFAEIAGFSGDEGVGLPARALYRSDEEYETLGREAAQSLNQGKTFQKELWMRRRDGREVWIRLSCYVESLETPTLGTVWFVEDVTEAKRTAEQLRHTAREMETIIQSAPVAFVFTCNERVLSYNSRFAEMFGIDGDDEVGQPGSRLYRSLEEYQAIGARAFPLLSQGKPFQAELWLRRRDGTDFWANLYGYVLNPDDPSEGTVWICEDRTAAKQAEEELRFAKERAEAANRAKSQFLANMSHELRTPLNAILGYAQILKHEQPLDARQSVGLNTIQQSGEHLLTLINDILDLSRIEAGRLDLFPGAFQLAPFLEVITDIIRIRAQQKSIAFVFALPPGLPRAVIGDERRLRQVLLNLLGNAVKFTDHGQVIFRVQAAAADGARARLRFEIEDTGLGIEAAHLEAIFQPFEQAGDLQRRRGGTGLGLAISRQMVRLMGSDIHVQSTVGRGSLLWFELELAFAPPQPATTTVRFPVSYQGAHKTILIVDDVAENRAVLYDMLTPLGFDLMEASDGAAALELAGRTPPDLIIMDTVMPGMDGLTATWRLREMPRFRQAPIIAISASASEADRERCLTGGANAFLPKPIDLTDLLAEVGRLLRVSWIYDGAAPPPAAASERALPARAPVAPRAAAVAQLPLALRDTLAQALIQLDAEAVARAIDVVDMHDPALARSLALLAGEFQYERILHLLQAVDAPPAREAPP
jgi:PAS domain S-box-containing protein